MKFKYRLKGKVDRQFCLRGMLFPIGNKLDLYLFENELDFVKDHSRNVEIIELNKQNIETPKTMLEEKENKVVNSNGRKQKSIGNKRTNKSNL